jgi:ribosome maturation factor RimP
MDHVEKKIFDVIQPLCDKESVILYKISVNKPGKSLQIKITVDTEEGITLHQCQQLSQKFSDYFYQKDLLEGDYRLEVSSPGITKPLEHAFEYKRNIGKDLTIEYLENDQKITVVGELKGMEENKITIESKKNEILIPLSSIKTAKVKLKW